jgi:thiol-disulfide isomerase/thioredoxin
MTDPSAPIRFRRSVVAAAVVAGCAALAAAAVYGTGFMGGNGLGAPGAAEGCGAAKAAAERMAPLARGEVAAVEVEGEPKIAPEIAFVGPDAGKTTLADLKGRTLLVNLWATWCAPCRQEMPALDRLQSTLGGPEFEVVAINLDTRNVEKPRAWLADNGVRSLSYYADPEGRVLPALQKSIGVVGLPTSILVDARGCQIATLKGPADWASEDATRLLRAALGR